MQGIDLTSPPLSITAAVRAGEFLDHYKTFWAGATLEESSLSADEIATRRSLVLRHVTASDELLRARGFSTEHIRAILFVGNGSANGHAYLDRDGAVVWFAIECFKSEMEAKIFTMHELIHALHYAARPEFSFQTIEQKNTVWRQLITEGIATYLTKRLWNLTDEEALWADALPPDQIQSWMTACRDSEKELFEFVRENFESSDPSIELFYSANPADIFSYRAGYYVGMKVIESIAAEYDLSDHALLNMPLEKLKRFIWEAFQHQASTFLRGDL
ncbi:MAG TPA: DUF2268 domain-containing putative Zn-dependent protease [Candidatus Kapabacteria bacterium]|nr:DUF2268 domain-containing putative Zn-dependent protease [Candidatus Kapabacteria bacterium]